MEFSPQVVYLTIYDKLKTNKQTKINPSLKYYAWLWKKTWLFEKLLESSTTY